MPRIAVIVVAIILFLPRTAFSAEQTVIGSYQKVTGQALAFHTGAQAADPIRNGLAVYLHDRIETGAKSTVTLKFIDDTTIVMGPNGSLTVGEYVFDRSQPERNKARFQILKAAFSFIDGRLARRKNPDMRLDLDLGWLAVRGTKLWRGMRDQQCWIYLERGAVTVNNDGGHVTLLPGESTRMSGRTLAPSAPAPWKKQDIDWIAQELGRPARE